MDAQRGNKGLLLGGWIALAAVVLLGSGCAVVPTAEPAPEITANQPNNLGMAVAVPPELLRQPSAPTRYVVQRGDTLWDISSHFLANPWLWPEIWLVNPQIANPHLIYPGDIISLQWINGKPVLRLERGDGVQRLKPLVRTTPLPQPVPALPMAAIKSFIEHARFIDEDAAKAAPYILAPADGHLMAAKGMDVFARRLPDGADANWQVMRAGQHYYDPETGELLGREGIVVGAATLLRDGDPARLTIDESLREARRGDLLFPLDDDDYVPELLLQPVAEDVDARVVAGFDVITRIGQYQIVTLNRGRDSGLELGATFEGFAPDEEIRDTVAEKPESVWLPGEYRGLAVVFRVDERVAHALVMNARQAMRVGDYLRSPLLSTQ
jgi:hypothetical protein